MDINIRSIEASGGAFYVTDASGNKQKVDLGTLMMMLNLDRVNNIDKQIEAQIAEITERNNRLKELTEFMSLLRSMKANGTGDQQHKEIPVSELTKYDPMKHFTVLTIVIDGVTYLRPKNFDSIKDGKVYSKEMIPANLTMNGQTKPIYGPGSWAEEFGITWTPAGGARPSKDSDKDMWNQRYEANINAIKGQIDMLNNDSQMDNIKLQNLLEKRSNAFEMATKVMDTNNQSVQSTIRNL